MSDSEQGAKWRIRLTDVGAYFQRNNEKELTLMRTLDALNALETQLATFKTQLEAAEGKAGLADEMAERLRRLRQIGVAPLPREIGWLESYDALSAPASDTHVEEVWRKVMSEPFKSPPILDQPPASDTGSEEENDASMA